MLALSKSILPLSTMTLSLVGTAYGTSIFAFDSHSTWEQPQPSVITDDTAKRLLELRMEAPTSSLGEVDQGTVELLNRIGGSPIPLFTTTSSNEVSPRSLVIVHGVNPELCSSMRDEFQTSLVVREASDDFWQDEFIDSLLGSHSGVATEERHCVSVENSKAGSEAVEVLYTGGTIGSCVSESSIFRSISNTFDAGQVEQAHIVASELNQHRPVSLLTLELKPSASSDSTFLRTLFHGLQNLALDGAEVTTLLSPKSAQNVNHTLHSRSAAKANTIRGPLGGQLEQSSITPVCYASNTSCNDATNTCSGHGFCYKKSSTTNEGAAGDCYTCRCQKTTVRKSDGTVQSVQWGGSACQKRDISSPFFLIAGISILMVVAISAAIGMLFNIGQGELPGVIGAGVGTTTQK